MDQDRIFNKLDSIEEQNRVMLIALTRLQEQIKPISDIEERVRVLEKWKWGVTSSVFMGAVSLAASAYKFKTGA